MIRVATFAQQSLTLSHALNTQARLADLQTQLATDKKAQSYDGIHKDSYRLVMAEVGRTQAAQFITNIDTADRRLELMSLAMTQVDQMGSDFRSTLFTAINAPDSSVINLKELAGNTRNALAVTLNSQDGDRYLFGGTRSDRPPVSLAAADFSPIRLIESDGTTVDSTFYEAYYTQVQGNSLPFARGTFYKQIYFEKHGVDPTAPLPADENNPTLAEFVADDPDLWQFYVDRLDSAAMLATPKIDYYQGNTQAQSIRTDEASDVTYDVRADSVAIQQIITAIDAVANLPQGSTLDPFEQAIVAKAHAMVNRALEATPADGFESITSLTTKLIAPRDSLSFARDRQVEAELYAEGLIADLEGIDEAEVIVRLQKGQQVLEASFATLARVQSVSLLNYL